MSVRRRATAPNMAPDKRKRPQGVYRPGTALAQYRRTVPTVAAPGAYVGAPGVARRRQAGSMAR